MNKIIAYSVCVIYFFTSCASYNYNGRNNDRLITIKADNVNDFQVVNTKTSTKLSTASSGKINTTLTNLKKENLNLTLSHPNYESINIVVKRSPRTKVLLKDVGLGLFTFGIPVIIDVFRSDFYRVAQNSKQFQVHFEFKQSFMNDEYQKIKSSTDPAVFQDWVNKYQKSNILQAVLDHKDSLELTIALSMESEKSIDDYINTHQESNYLAQAKQIKSEMVAARELFEKSISLNTVEAFETFLEKYPRSIHNTDAHKRLIDAAEKRAVASLNSSKMTEYIKVYLIPYSRFLSENELSVKKNSISKVLDLQLIKENIKTDPKKTYDYYSNLWKAYLNIRSEISTDYLNHLEQTFSYQSKICNLLFAKLKECSTKEKQDVLVAKIKSDFPSLDINDDSKNPIITILENFQNGSGTVKLFNVGYFPYLFENMSERNVLIGRSNYSYRGTDFQALKGITYEEISLVNGQLNGLSKCFVGSQIDFTLNMGSSGPKEISYYQNGKLVLTTTFLPNYKEYSYEYSNGVNLTLQALDSKINEGKNLIASGNYDNAISLLENALKNDIPSTVNQNMLLQKTLSAAKTQKSAYLKKQEDLRIAEEKKRQALLIAEEKRKAAEEAERKKPIILRDYYQLWDYPSQFIGRNVSMVVWQTPGADDYVIYQREYRETKKGSTRNNMFKGTQYYIDPSQLETESYYYNWKHFTEATTQKNITVNIPDRFFDQNLIPHNTGSSYYIITVNVYPMRESRGYGQKGKYNDGGGAPSEVTYELVDIKRYIP